METPYTPYENLNPATQGEIKYPQHRSINKLLLFLFWFNYQANG